MPEVHDRITIRGAREHNLKNITLSIARDKLKGAGSHRREGDAPAPLLDGRRAWLAGGALPGQGA
jgi:hypothetical protein